MHGTASTLDREERMPALALGVFVAIVAAKFLIHALVSGRYGYFRDELYFLDMARHLAPGYVDAAPLVAIYGKVALLLGGSLPALRLISALAGAGVVALTIHLTRLLGGGRFAQALAGIAALLSPSVLAIDNILSMNAFEPLFWMGCVAVLIRMIQSGNSRLWIWFGVLAGLGLENKHSTAFFGMAVVVALLLTEHRREFLKPWIWAGGAIALLIFLPNLIWQWQHHFPTLEDLENVRRSGKNVVLGPVAFVTQQIIMLQPFFLPLWVAGVVSLFRRRRYRVLGWTFVVFFVVMFLMGSKDYYLFPIYPMTFAAGAVAFEGWFAARPRLEARLWPKATLIAIMALSSLPDIFLLPVLSPAAYVSWMQKVHLSIRRTEVGHRGALPQIFGDQFGWPEMVREVAGIYRSLPPEERAQTGIFANNYGEAGAINLFGPQYGLPPANSSHQNHYFWGPPRPQMKNYIVLQDDRETLERICDKVEEPVVHYHPYGMEEENRPIHVCLGLKLDMAKNWARMKHWN